VLVVEREEGASILQREAGPGGTSRCRIPGRCFESATRCCLHDRSLRGRSCRRRAASSRYRPPTLYAHGG